MTKDRALFESVKWVNQEAKKMASLVEGLGRAGRFNIGNLIYSRGNREGKELWKSGEDTLRGAVHVPEPSFIEILVYNVIQNGLPWSTCCSHHMALCQRFGKDLLQSDIFLFIDLFPIVHALLEQKMNICLVHCWVSRTQSGFCTHRPSINICWLSECILCKFAQVQLCFYLCTLGKWETTNIWILAR